MNHPNVLKSLEVFTSHRNCYIVTELCNQGDLDTLFKQKQKMTDTEIRTIIADIYRGLQYIASKNIIHRDLKIANVFMHNGVAKIADFGFALHCTYLLHNLAIISKISTLALLCIWLRKASSIIHMAPKLMFGPLESYYMNCIMVILHSATVKANNSYAKSY